MGQLGAKVAVVGRYRKRVVSVAYYVSRPVTGSQGRSPAMIGEFIAYRVVVAFTLRARSASFR